MQIYSRLVVTKHAYVIKHEKYSLKRPMEAHEHLNADEQKYTN